jgi:hypothetical protein
MSEKPFIDIVVKDMDDAQLKAMQAVGILLNLTNAQEKYLYNTTPDHLAEKSFWEKRAKDYLQELRDEYATIQTIKP